MSGELDAVRQLQEEHGSNVAFVVNHSSGNSTRVLGYVRRFDRWVARFRRTRICERSTSAIARC